MAAVQNGAGTIGYADESQAGDLGQAAIKVGDTFNTPSAEGAAVVLDESHARRRSRRGDRPRDPGQPHHDRGGCLPDHLGLVPDGVLDVQRRRTMADLVKAFGSYVISEDGQNAAAWAAGSAPITDTIRTRLRPRSTRSPPVMHLRPVDTCPHRCPPGPSCHAAESQAKEQPQWPRRPRSRTSSPPRRAGDQIFKGLATAAGIIILLALAGVAIFLTAEGYPAISASPASCPRPPAETPASSSTCGRSSSEPCWLLPSPSSSRRRSRSASHSSSRTTRPGASLQRWGI